MHITNLRHAGVRVSTCLCLTLLPLLAAAAPALGQGVLRVAIPDSFPAADSRAMVMRFAGAGQPDVILLHPAHADASSLAASLVLRRHLSANDPSGHPPRNQVALVSGFVGTRAPDPRALAKLGALLDRVRAQPSSRIGNVGSGKWLEVPDPDPRR